MVYKLLNIYKFNNKLDSIKIINSQNNNNSDKNKIIHKKYKHKRKLYKKIKNRQEIYKNNKLFKNNLYHQKILKKKLRFKNS